MTDDVTAALDTRRRLLDAARSEFAVVGFDGASTRRIATAASSHQPQINYFFGSKDVLWRAVVEDLYIDLHASMAEIDRFDPPGEVLAAVIAAFVRFAHRRPELHQILFHEFSAASERLDWFIEIFSGPSFVDFHKMWDAVVASGEAADIDPRVAFHIFVGAASLLPVARAEAAQQLGAAADDDDLLHAHATSLVQLLLPGRLTSTSGRSTNDSTESSKR